MSLGVLATVGLPTLNLNEAQVPTVQAVMMQTLKSANDLPAARETLDRRICAMAKAHDLLRSRDWSAANLAEVVARALDAFPVTQLRVSGVPVDISARQALALSMALHELATNAAKYGALSASSGRVSIEWDVKDGTLDFAWEESGGPPVTPPSERGFGSRLLERLLISDLGGEIRLDYDPQGLNSP